METMRSNDPARVLVVDDDPSVLMAVADRCVRMGFDVQTATNGLRALIKAGEYEPDVLIIDVHLPEVDGLTTLAYLQEIGKKSPHVIVVTGRPGQEITEKCREFDARCIRKGYHFWNELEAGLAEISPKRRRAIKQLWRQAPAIKVKRSPRVLLIDDDIDVKNSFFSRFKLLGADLSYAPDGTRGFWKARREQPSVIVSDYYMPNGDAEYLLSRLRKTPETAAIPVIVQSGRQLDAPVKDRLRQSFHGQPGVARIISKHDDGRVLFDALQRLCGFVSDLDGESLYQ